MLRIQGMLLAAALLGALSTPGRADEKPSPTVDYFLGESKMFTPAGKHIGTSLSLVKRIVSRAEGRIEEHVLSVRDDGSARSFVVVLVVKGNKFTMSEKSKSFEGEGELIGDPWKWKEWKSVAKLAGGAGKITSEDKLTDQGL